MAHYVAVVGALALLTDTECLLKTEIIEYAAEHVTHCDNAPLGEREVVGGGYLPVLLPVEVAQHVAPALDRHALVPAIRKDVLYVLISVGLKQGFLSELWLETLFILGKKIQHMLCTHFLGLSDGLESLQALSQGSIALLLSVSQVPNSLLSYVHV
jgi:hypothetical protein